MSIAVGTQHAMRVRHIVMRPAPLYNIFPHYVINGKIFEKKKVTENIKCVLISSITFVWNTSHYKKNWARYNQKRLVAVM